MASRSCIAALIFLTAHAHASAQVLDTQRVAMRAGVELATAVWRADDSPRPVVLRRTPYGRAVAMDAVNGLVALGYAIVSQDVRGRGESDGTFAPFLDDAHDGADTIAWIAAQPWSNGHVASFGGSAEGIVQLMAAGEGPPALDCIHATVATGDVYEAVYPGGAWRTELGTAWLNGLMEPEALATLRAHEAADAFWDPGRLDDAEAARARAGVFMVGGFYDIFASGTPRTFSALQSANPDAPRFLVLGPWTHGGLGTTTQGELEYPADATYAAYIEDLATYLAFCLQDGAAPSWPPVRYNVSQIADDGRSASGEWRSASAWPPPSAPIELRLHADGSLRASAPTVDDAPAMLAVDPSDPVPSSGGGNLTTPAGPFDQSAIDARPDVLTAETPRAEESVEIIGDVTARIYAATNGTDGDVVERLEQVTPRGPAMLLAEGVRRGRFITRPDAITPLAPDELALFEVDVGPVAFVLPAGHALRVAIAGTSSPHYEPSPGVADPIASATPVATTLTVFRDAARPSAIVLPIARGTPPGAEDVSLSPDAGMGDGGGAGGCGCGAIGRATGSPPLLALAAVLLLVRRRSQRRA